MGCVTKKIHNYLGLPGTLLLSCNYIYPVFYCIYTAFFVNYELMQSPRMAHRNLGLSHRNLGPPYYHVNVFLIIINYCKVPGHLTEIFSVLNPS